MFNRLKRLLTGLWDRKSPNEETLREILSSRDNREFFLGVQNLPPMTEDRYESEVTHILRHSSSEDYSSWAKEAWSEAIRCLDKLTGEELADRDVDFYRGSLSQTLKLLRISFKARSMKMQSALEKKNRVPLNGINGQTKTN